ncbi:MAG: hypothetical protein M3373_11570 [Gemmatimonadota bacterium]|nr:hypothetical protein [Gemmatimonadota bacterium]
MRYVLVLCAAAVVAAGCTRYDDDGIGPGPGDGAVDAPSDLRYQLIPSGDPDRPDGVLLRWTDSGDGRIASFVVYSRGSTSDGWGRRAETTSNSFHDTGVPHLQYAVTSQDEFGDESGSSNVVTIDERNRLPAPNALASVSLDRAMQLSWASNARQADPSLFDYYRLYSSPYDLDDDECDDVSWVLEGTTVSEDFLSTGLANGAPRCFAVSTVSIDGHESAWSRPRSDTPRYDARNVVVYAPQVRESESGFRFYLPTGGTLGNVLAGTRADLDFRIERRPDGSLWFAPVRAGVRVALYGNSIVTDLTSIDVAPVSGYSTGAIEALPGYLYVFETLETDGLHYGAVRVTHVSRDYVIVDWAYQSDPGNPDLHRMPKGYVLER